MMALAAMQHMKMPIWNFQKHLVKQARLYSKPDAVAASAFWIQDRRAGKAQRAHQLDLDRNRQKMVGMAPERLCPPIPRF
jgi:hypothetical protein